MPSFYHPFPAKCLFLYVYYTCSHAVRAFPFYHIAFPDVRNSVFDCAERALSSGGRAFSGIVAGSRRNVYAVFIRSSASFRFCFEKKRCQNILLPVCINIHFRSATGFFSRHMACCLRRGGDGGAMRESFIKRPILLF